MAKLLTPLAVQKMRPGPKKIEVRDAGCRGLLLIIQTSGLKSWGMRFRDRNGDLVRLTLGAVDVSGAETTANPVMGIPLTLVGARALAAEVNRQRALGQDVVATKQREQQDRDTRTFEQAAIDFVNQHVIRKIRRWQAQARLLGLRQKEDGKDGGKEGELELIPNGLAARWKGKAAAEIDGDDVHTLIDEVREKGTPGIERRNRKPSDPRARTMFAVLSKMFAWLVERRRIKTNPCTGVRKPKPPKARDRVLTDAEIKKFWQGCGELTKPFGHALRLLLLTGCRLNEVASMMRSELSEDGLTWTIAGERTKNHRAHVVPLPATAQAILAEVGSSSKFIFTTNNRSQISGWSKIKKDLDAKMNTQPWRIHDLRRSAATGMAELGIQPHIVEAALNHISGAKASVAGTYNRAVYTAEKKAALERWAAHIEGLVAGRPDNVVALPRGVAS
jgi:integrase